MNNQAPSLTDHVPQWEETKERYAAWWRGSSLGRPLLRIIGRRSVPLPGAPSLPKHTDPELFHMDAEREMTAYRHWLYGRRLLAEAYPNTNINLGAGSLAVYLGSEPIFDFNTVWFTEVIEEMSDGFSLRFDPDNRWFRRHLEATRTQLRLSSGEVIINIPDIIENLDIFAAMRGPQAACLDLMDSPRQVSRLLSQIDDLYPRYYDEFYNLVKGNDGSSSFTAFNVWGPGKTAKLQCDFAAMISPEQFREFVMPALERQTREMTCTVFHLDGVDAIRHVDALMEIEGLRALQWTAGAGKPDGGDERWWEPIYDKVRKAGRSLHIHFSDGGPDLWYERASKLVRRYGPDGLFFLFPEMAEADAHDFLARAEKEWH